MISELLQPQHTLFDVDAPSKKAILEIIAKDIYKDIDCDCWSEVFDALIAREKYGSTGFGSGIAIPHCRLERCNKPIGVLIKLKEPVGFDAIDQLPVDLVFALIVPSEENEGHLEILSCLSSIFDQEETREKLRESETQEVLFTQFQKMLEK